jgi:tetratricopeptide (TPR) repeat protein
LEIQLGGDVKAAVGTIRDLLSQKSACPDFRQILSEVYNLGNEFLMKAEEKNRQGGGNIYFSAGLAELDAAIGILEALSEYQPEAADIWYTLGFAYDHRTRLAEAEECYRRAIALDPHSVVAGDAWMNLGVLARNKALKVGDTALAGIPKQEVPLLIKTNLNDPLWREAEQCFEHSLEVHTRAHSSGTATVMDVIRARVNLARFYDKRLDPKRACVHYRELVKLDPDNQEALDYIEQSRGGVG